MLNEQSSIVIRRDRFYEGDIIRFKKKSRRHQVENGQRGEIVEIDQTTRKLVVRLEDETLRILPLDAYDHISGGYVSTIHAGQGQTAERTYLFVTGHMVDSEMTYTQVSRTSKGMRLFTTEEDAGEELTTLAKRMSRSRPKELAHDVGDEVEKRLELTLVGES